jgi:uncharacterized protein (DUF433 family)
MISKSSEFSAFFSAGSAHLLNGGLLSTLSSVFFFFFQKERYAILSAESRRCSRMEKLMDRIEINPKILVGKPVIRGTRIPVELIIKLFAQGWQNEEILKEYPSLKTEDIRAALLYAEKVLEEEEVYPIIG